MASAQLLLIGVIVIAIGAVALVGLLLARRSRPRSRRIVVFGIGGAGGNAVDRMVRARMSGVDFIACNTDAQVLGRSRARRKIQIGEKLTGGLGAGGDPVIGQRAAEEDAGRIGRAIAGADMVFIAAGLGGGTGSGAAPVVAAQARQAGALTVGIVTLPFVLEGPKRREIADRAAEALGASVDTLIVVPNDGVRNVVLGEITMLEAFRIVDDLLREGIASIVEIIAQTGFINLDFADVRSVMEGAGSALMGVGRAVGDDRATEAARAAIGNPLLGGGIAGTRAILLSVAGPPELTMTEVMRAVEVVREAADPEADVILGATFDERLGDAMQVTVIATGFAPATHAEGDRRPIRSGRIAQGKGRTPASPAIDADEGPNAAAGERGATPNPPAEEERVEGDSNQAFDASPNDLDVPTFLRRQVPGPGERA